MKEAMFATKKDTYDYEYKGKPVGSHIEYPTTRTAIVEELEVNDLIYIRVQGPGSILLKTRLVKLDGVKKTRNLILEIREILTISAEDFFRMTCIKAGAEFGWITTWECNAQI